MLAFWIWAAVGAAFVLLGICCFFQRRPVGFWANARPFEVADARAYNAAVGRMWCVAGAVFLLLGLPLLAGQDSPLVLLSVLGAFFWAFGLMVWYTQVITRRHRR